jgi:hypothetical protein
MKLLTKQEVQDILLKSSLEVKTICGYRLGQAIYNNLPNRMCKIYNGTDKDIYRIKDDDLAITMLLNLAEPM